MTILLAGTSSQRARIVAREAGIQGRGEGDPPCLALQGRGKPILLVSCTLQSEALLPFASSEQGRNTPFWAQNLKGPRSLAFDHCEPAMHDGNRLLGCSFPLYPPWSPVP